MRFLPTAAAYGTRSALAERFGVSAVTVTRCLRAREHLVSIPT
ncbi:MAG TPA: hypothetical protein VH231_09715 [Solirubrobacteraceae bacterium]|jgi:hypothetical protein|nr:hypothetical protein [Solirubrobacteraceae bacterium]